MGYNATQEAATLRIKRLVGEDGNGEVTMQQAQTNLDQSSQIPILKLPLSLPESNKLTFFNQEKLGEFERLNPYRNSVVNHKMFQQAKSGILPVDTCKKTFLNTFPLVENFPKFLALSLAKTRYLRTGHEVAKEWLIGNIRVEKNHTKWFVEWAESFGVTKEELASHRPNAFCSAIVDYLWLVGRQESLAVSIAATNVGVEWATGEWSRQINKGIAGYIEKGIVPGPIPKTMAWLNAHADYDDTHPYEAMELVYRCAESEEDLAHAMEAGKRSLQLYALMLDECFGRSKDFQPTC